MTAPPRAPADRTRVPQGYAVTQHEDMIDEETRFLPTLLYRECEDDTEAVAACWAHHDAIHERGKAEGRAEERAAVVAWWRSHDWTRLCADVIERGDHATEHRDALTRREAEAGERGYRAAMDSLDSRITRARAEAQWDAEDALLCFGLQATETMEPGPEQDACRRLMEAFRRRDQFTSPLLRSPSRDALSKALTEAREEGRRAERERIRAAERVSCRYAHEPPGSGDDRPKVVLIVRDAKGRRESIDLRPEHFHVDDRDRLTEARAKELEDAADAYESDHVGASGGWLRERAALLRKAAGKGGTDA